MVMEYRLKDDVQILSNKLDFEEYLPYIEEEVKIIKTNFPQELINQRLSVPLDEIDGEQETDCIYGKLTGSCFNKEAHDVIFQLPFVVRSTNVELESYKNRENFYRGQYFLSPIEHYISPSEDEILDIEEDENGDDVKKFDDSYLKRVKKIVDLLTNN